MYYSSFIEPIRPQKNSRMIKRILTLTYHVQQKKKHFVCALLEESD